MEAEILILKNPQLASERETEEKEVIPTRENGGIPRSTLAPELALALARALTLLHFRVRGGLCVGGNTVDSQSVT